MNMQQIKRRKVFYIPGFDPFPARRYRELYRANSQEQATISGYTISQSALHLKDRFGWQVNASFGDQDCEAEIEVLVVGHSSGAHLAVSVLAELGRRNQIKCAPMPIGLLS